MPSVRLLQFSNVDVVQRAYGICTGRHTIERDNIRKWIRLGHESPIEHWVATFMIDGISRSCSHQIVRHRIASYSQESMRYVNVSDAGRVIPPSIGTIDDALRVYMDTINAAQSAYKKLLDIGIKKEDARFVLPISTWTRLIVTMNARSLRNFFRLRLGESAQWEIREVARQMLDLVLPLFPEAFDEFVKQSGENPYENS